MSLKRPFQYGSLELPSNIFCAPLAGCSDLPFRRMTTKFRPGLVFCEMVKMDALVRRNPQTLKLLDFEESMHPIGAQLVGSKSELAAPCARMLEQMGFDVIDLNCGCPVDKVTRDGSGSGMLKTPELIGEILANMKAAVKIPITVKIRMGWDANHLVAPEITQIAEQAGATAICIHGRTRAQGYKGAATWSIIRECKNVAKNILVIGNGDIFDARGAVRIWEETGCDAILLARGTMGQPWLIEDIVDYCERKMVRVRDGEYVKKTLLEHVEHIISYQVERRALLDMRRVGCWFLRNGHGMRSLREMINRSQSIHEIRQLISDYDWSSVTITFAGADENSQC